MLRRRLPFRLINRRADPDYQPGMQRHHLLPRQLLSARCFGPLFERLGRDSVGFDDFRRNGLLLPSTDRAVARIGLPLHRGPHRHYNAMVFERVGQIEGRWAERRLDAPGDALEEALFRLGLLQQALRRRLMVERRRLLLNRADPLGEGRDFAELDAMAELLWRETESADSGHGIQPLICNSS
ncbi:MAG: AHH domain-containing protein [Croceibacterium sp.]